MFIELEWSRFRADRSAEAKCYFEKDVFYRAMSS